MLIQLYRTGADHISEHSDKTVDMVDVVGRSRIVNLSLDAWRSMTLRMKKDVAAAGEHASLAGNGTNAHGQASGRNKRSRGVRPAHQPHFSSQHLPNPFLDDDSGRRRTRAAAVYLTGHDG